MTNRVTDQSTQNDLIGKFRLEGLLPEMSVSPMIIPTVSVASLQSALTVGIFEKWRSVLQKTPRIIDTANLTLFVNPLVTAITKVAPTSNVVTDFGTVQAGGFFGCALPGGSVGNPATDGVYRVVITGQMNGAANTKGAVVLYDQAAFGDPVALGTPRIAIGTYSSAGANTGEEVLFDAFVLIRETDLANSVILNASFSTGGTGALDITVTKLIDEIPPFVIFP